MPGQFTPPTLQGTVKKLTPNYSLIVPKFDAPGWGLALEENFDVIDSLIYVVTGITGIQGVWNNSTLYVVAARVTDNSTDAIYQCVVQHTSAATGTFAEDRLAHPTYWILITNTSIPRGQWTTATNYNTGEFVTDSGRTGIVTRRYTSGASYNADVTAGNLATIVDTSGFLDFKTAINSAPNKSPLIDTDLFGVVDKVVPAAPVTKNHTWLQLKSGIATYGNTLWQATSAILTATTASFTTALLTKLNGIATGANVTDATSVGATLGAATPSGTIADTDELAGNTGNTLKTWTWAVLKATLRTYLEDIIVQPGTIVATGRNTPDPGYLECNGAAVARVGTYAALFAAISTRYGAADGTVNFNIPELRGEFLRGWDHGRGVDAGRVQGGAVQASDLGSHAHAITIPAIPAHSHTYGPITGTYGLNGQTYAASQFHSGSGDSERGSYTMVTSAAGGVAATPVNTTSTGIAETRPRNVSVMFQIKY